MPKFIEYAHFVFPLEKDFAISLSLNITLKRFEIFSHERNEECDNTVFKHHRISAFVTADLITKEVKLVVVLHNLMIADTSNFY